MSLTRTSTCVLNTSRDDDYHFSVQFVPVFDYFFTEENFPNVQFKPLLVHLEAIPLVLPLAP